MSLARRQMRIRTRRFVRLDFLRHAQRGLQYKAKTVVTPASLQWNAHNETMSHRTSPSRLAASAIAALAFGAFARATRLTRQCSLVPLSPSLSNCTHPSSGWWYHPRSNVSSSSKPDPILTSVLTEAQLCFALKTCQPPPFGSFSECAAACRPSPCVQSPLTGPCRARKVGYYFEAGRCKPFVWGRCGGRIPFHSLSACQRHCEHIPYARIPHSDQRCVLQSEHSTDCMADKMFVEAFFYNASLGVSCSI